MKKLIPFLIIGVLVLSGFGTIAVTNTMNGTTAVTYGVKTKQESIVISKPIVKEAGQYVTVNLKEATSSLTNEGKPILPIVTRVYTLAFGTKISNVDVSFSGSNELLLEKKVQPASEPIPVSTATAQIAVESAIDGGTYGSSALYPSSGYSYNIGAGLNGEEHVIYLVVQCYPIRYSPTDNKIDYANSINIKVTYQEPTTPRVFSDKYDLVIISPSEFSSELQPLITHKTSMGVNTILKTTEEIYSQYSGRDNAEKIKYFIKDAIETWGIHYVLLVGGVDKLPIRTSYASFWGEGLITDLYYADIYNGTGSFCSWDKNGNGKYGEISHDHDHAYDIDGVDLYPDVNVGRLPCEKSAEVKTVVNKIIHYETETYGESWFKNMIFVGGDTFPGDDGNEGENQNQITEQIMSDFTPTQLWTSDNTFSASSLNKAINRGAGFVDYSGHGFEIGVATHPSNSETWVPYHTNHLLGAINGYKLPIAFFDACLTAKLDFDVNNLTAYLPGNFNNIVSQFNIGSKLLPCFAWCCVAKSSGGFIATIGATRTAFGGIDYGCGYLAIHFWQAYKTSDKVSQMLTKAQNDYITNIPDDLFTVEEFILIGDPSLKIGGYPQSQGLKANIENTEESVSGYPDTTLKFQASANNGQPLYTFKWDFNEDGMYNDATGENAEWTWDSPGAYKVSVKVTDTNNNENIYDTIVDIESKSNSLSGPSTGALGTGYTFTAQAKEDTSSQEQIVYYYFDWGDGTFSDVLGPYSSDTSVEATHTWSSNGVYQVRVKTLKINLENLLYEETGWSDPLTVSMTKDSTTNDKNIFVNPQPGSIYTSLKVTNGKPLSLFGGLTLFINRDIKVTAQTNEATMVKFTLEKSGTIVDSAQITSSDETFTYNFGKPGIGFFKIKAEAYQNNNYLGTDSIEKIFSFSP